jgi:hypothetical protein
MSFNSGNSIQHRGWNLFVEGGGPPPVPPVGDTGIIDFDSLAALPYPQLSIIPLDYKNEFGLTFHSDIGTPGIIGGAIVDPPARSFSPTHSMIVLGVGAECILDVNPVHGYSIVQAQIWTFSASGGRLDIVSNGITHTVFVPDAFGDFVARTFGPYAPPITQVRFSSNDSVGMSVDNLRLWNGV